MGGNLTWYCEDNHKEATYEEISEVEALWDVKLPDDYKMIAIKYHGCTSLEDVVEINGQGEAFGYLLSYSKDEHCINIIKIYDAIKDRLIDKVYPFADDPGGNHYCFDYRESDANPKIVFWDHEIAFEDPEKAITYLCDSFTELLLNLHEYEDEDDE